MTCYFVRGSLVALIATVGCNSPPPRVVPDRPAGNSAAQALEMHDTNKDGYLSGAELEATPGLKAAMSQVDANQDDKISADEITARINAWAKSGVGRMTVACVVTYKGQPLSGAEVKLVPEKFLGDKLKPATATTGGQGNAMLTAPHDDVIPPGVGPGFYRVEITGPTPLPEKFNTQTTLGVEIAVDAKALGMGPLQFEVGN